MVLRNSVPRLMRGVAAIALGIAALMPLHAADPAPFDLPGPGLRVTVTRGEKTLPIGEVPGLATGDKVTIRADLPPDQRAHFLLLSAFLTGATNPPPKEWIKTAETWKDKEKDKLLTLTVPEGARQIVLFLVPDTGGASGAIADAVRGRPGEFVRASQDLNQASLDRSRLNAFMAAIRAQENTHPEFLKTIAPTLASSLAIKLNGECLAKVIELQAACLLENRDSLVLADVHSSTMAETLVGAPTDLALQLSYTREGGLGYFSPYISVVRDLARVFGAFSNPQLDYLPTISQRQGDGISLLLNAAPSFSKPKSVMVTSLPAIGSDTPPQLHGAAEQPLCGARPGLVLPVDGAPLIYSTSYARDMTVRLTNASGQTVELPVEARADRGGYVVKGGINAVDFKGAVTGRLHGYWGFDAFEGPEFQLQFPTGEDWSTGEDTPSLVIGRDNQLVLRGPAPACVESVTVRRGAGPAQRIEWKPQGQGAIAATVKLAGAQPGDQTVEVRQFGAARASTLTLPAYAQASRLDRLTLHTGDDWGELSGQRLDQVASVDLGGVRLKPDGLSRDGDTDRLRIAAEAGAQPKGGGTAQVTLGDGRTLNVPVTIAGPRPRATLLDRSLSPKGAREGLPLDASGTTLLPDTARLVFSLRAADGTKLLPSDGIEIATADHATSTKLAAGPDLRLQGPVMVATFDPAALGPSAAGALEFRVVRGDERGDWQPLATLARVPRIDAVDCAGAPGNCALKGQALFLIDAVSASASFDKGAAIPLGYTGGTIAVPAPQDGKLYLRLRDAPKDPLVLSIPTAAK